MADNTIRLENDFKPIRDSIDKLIGSLGKLEARLESVQKDVSIFDRLFGNTKQFNEFVKSVNQLNKVSTDAFGSLARGLAQIGTAFKTFPSNFNIDGFKLFTDEVLKFFEKLASLNIVFNKDQIQSLSSLSKVFTAIAKLSAVEIKEFKFSADSLNSLRELIGVLSNIPNNAPQKTGLLGKVVNSVKGIFDLNIGTRGNQNLEQFSTGLLAFSRAIKNINQNIGSVNVGKTISVFTKLSVGLQSVSFVLSKLPGSNQIEEFSKTFQRLGIGLSGIARGVEGIDNASVVKLVKTLGILAGAIKIISAVVRFGNDKNATAFSQILSSVIGALGQLNKIATFRNQADLGVTLKNQVKFLVSLIGAFRRLKGAQIPDIGSNIKAIVEAFKLFNEISVSSTKDTQKFEKFIDRIAKSLQRLNAIQIDVSKAAAIGKQVDALSRLTNLEGQLKSLQTSLNFSNFLQVVPLVINGIRSIINGILSIPRAVEQSLKNAGTQLNSFGDTLINRGRQILRAFSLDSLTKNQGFDVASQFLRISNQLKVFGDLNDEGVKQAQEFADTIGIKYPLSANEALQATLDLLKAGQDLNDTFAILPSAADLASLSDTNDIQLTTEALIAAEGAFSEFAEGVEGSFENIAVAADVLSAGADVSTASIESLAAGLADSAQAANIAGLNYQETVAALALLDKAQLKGAEGGRGLRSALNAIFTRDQAAEEFKKLGIAIFDTEGNIRNFDDILKDLNKRFAGFTQKQISDSLGNISDTFGRTALSVLIMNDGLSDTITQMNGVATAAEKAELALDNFEGDVEQLRGSFETLLKDVFVPLIERAFRPFVQVLRQVTDFILKLPDPVKEAASAFIFITSSLATLIGGATIALGVLSKLSGAILIIAGNAVGLIFNIQRLAIVFAGFATSVLVVLPAILAITGALAVFSEAVASAFRLVENNVGGAGKAFDRLRKTVEGIFGEVVRIITVAGQAIQVVFREFFGQSDTERGNALADTFNTITESLGSLLDSLRSIDLNTVIAFFARLRVNLEEFVASLTATVRDVSASVGDFIGPIRDAINILLPEIKNFVDSIVSLFSTAGEQTRDFPLVDTLAGIIRFLREVVVVQIRFIAGALNFLSENVIRPIVANIPKLVNAIRGFVDTLTFIFSPIVEFVTTQAGVVIDFFRKLPDLLFNFSDAGTAVRTLVGNFVKALLDLPKAIGKTIERIGLEIGSSLLFFIGNALRTGDFSAIVQVIGETIRDFIVSIPVFFINLGKDSGNNFITNFGLALQGGNIERIIVTLFDAARDLIGRLGLAVVSFLKNTVLRVLGTIFPDIQRTFEGNIFDLIAGLANFILLPVRAVIAAITRAFEIDLFVLGSDIAAGIIRGVAGAILGIVPGIFFLIAEQIENSALKSVFNFIAELARTVTDAVSGILAFPIQVLSSFFELTGAFFIFLDNIMVSKEIVILAFGAIILAVTGLSNAIVSFGERVSKAVGGVITPALTTLGNTVVSLRDRLAAAAASIRKSTVQIQTSVSNIRSGTVSGADQINATLGSMRSNLIGIARIPFDAIASGFRIIKSGLLALKPILAPIILIEAGLVSIKGLMDGLAASAEGLPFLRTMFQSIGESVLNLIGLEELIPNFTIALDSLQGLLEAFIQRIGFAIQRAFADILQGFNDLRARLEQASADLGLSEESEFAKQFFAVGDMLRNAGNVSGEEFFAGLGEALTDPADINALRSQLIPFQDVILKQFQDIINQTDGFLTALPADQLQDIIKTLTSSDVLGRAFAAFGENNIGRIQFFGQLDTQTQGKEFAAFMNSVIRNGVEDLDTASFRNAILNQLSLGNIDDAQASKFLEAFGFTNDAIAAAAGELQGRFEVLTQSTEELFAAAQQSNLDELNKQLQDGTISAQEYQEALSELGDEILTTIEGIREEKIAALTKQFDEGAISEAEFRKQFQLINEEARDTSIRELQEEIDRIATAAQQGAIPLEDAAKQIKALGDQIKELRPASGAVGALEAELDKLVEDFGAKAISAAKFAEEFSRISQAIEAAKQSAEGGIGGDTGTSEGGLSKLISNIFDTINERSTDGQSEMVEGLEEELEIREKIADFNRNEARQLEDDIREEQKKLSEIDEIRTDAAEKEQDDLIDFNRDRERAEQDHQNKLLEIARSANDAFNDAIAGRDASAAQSAQEQLREQTRQENSQFELDSRRAQEDFNLNRERAQRERDQKIAEAQLEFQDLVAKNERERARRLEDHNLEIAAERAKDAQLAAEQKTANDAELLTEKTHQTNMQNIIVGGVASIEAAVAQGLPGVVGLFTTALVNSYNQLAQVVGGVVAMNNATPYGAASPTPMGVPHARGGPVQAGKRYQVGDPIPEIYEDRNGRRYLIPGRSGYVTPMKQQYGGAGGSSSTSLTIGDINVNGANANPQQIASAIEKMITERLHGALESEKGRRRGL